MELYKKDKLNIENLDKIDIDKTDEKIYIYKNIYFLSKLKKNSKNLIVFFHGALPKTETSNIIFRGYNYNIDMCDILCVSDGLINVYTGLRIGWYLSTVKYPFENIYKEIFEHYINSNKYQRVIFTGTSGGGFPSIYWASYFGKVALISNAQFYIENFIKREFEKIGIRKINEILVKFSDQFIYEDKTIEKIILGKKPEKIIIFTNVNDKHFTDTDEFINFINYHGLNDIVEMNFFKGIEPSFGKTHHHINFPNNISYNKIIENYIIK